MEQYYRYTGKHLVHDGNNCYWEPNLIEIGSTFYYGDLDQTNEIPTEETKKELYIIPDMFSGGDYSRSCTIEISNHRVFLNFYKNLLGIHNVYGSYGSFGVAIRLDILDTNSEIKETLDNLENYGCLDEEDRSELEVELFNEAWNNWARKDFLRGLQSSYPLLEEYDPEESDLLAIFEEGKEDANEYWESEPGGSMYIRIDKIVPYARDILIIRLTPAKDLPLLIGYDWVSERIKEVFLSKLKA